MPPSLRAPIYRGVAISNLRIIQLPSLAYNANHTPQTRANSKSPPLHPARPVTARCSPLADPQSLGRPRRKLEARPQRSRNRLQRPQAPLRQRFPKRHDQRHHRNKKHRQAPPRRSRTPNQTPQRLGQRSAKPVESLPAQQSPDREGRVNSHQPKADRSTVRLLGIAVL